MLLSFVLIFLIPSKKCPKCDYPIISPCFLKLPAISNALYLLSNFNILSAVFCRTLCNRAVCCCSVSVCILSAVFCRTLCNLAVCPQPIKNIVTTPSFARTCESRITSCKITFFSSVSHVHKGTLGKSENIPSVPNRS